MLTTTRRRKSRMYDVRQPPAGPPNFYLFDSICETGHRYEGTVEQEEISGGGCTDDAFFWLASIPSQTWLAGEEERSALPGSTVMARGPGSVLPIHDFLLNQSEGSYQLPDTGHAATPAVHHGGFLWWVEVDSNGGGLTFALKRARPDLSEVSTVATGDVADPSGGGDLKWRGKNPLPAIAVADDAVISEWQWTTGTTTSAPLGAVRIRFPLPSGTFESAALPDELLTFGEGIAAPEGGFLTADGTEVLHSGGSTALALTWAGDYYPAGSTPRQVAAERVTVGPGGVLALFGDITGGGRGFAVAPSGGPHASAPAATLYDLGAAPGSIGFIHREGP
jgi:hypothetical protein